METITSKTVHQLRAFHLFLFWWDRQRKVETIWHGVLLTRCWTFYYKLYWWLDIQFHLPIVLVVLPVQMVNQSLCSNSNSSNQPSSPNSSVNLSCTSRSALLTVGFCLASTLSKSALVIGGGWICKSYIPRAGYIQVTIWTRLEKKYHKLTFLQRIV